MKSFLCRLPRPSAHSHRTGEMHPYPLVCSVRDSVRRLLGRWTRKEAAGEESDGGTGVTHHELDDEATQIRTEVLENLSQMPGLSAGVVGNTYILYILYS